MVWLENRAVPSAIHSASWSLPSSSLARRPMKCS